MESTTASTGTPRAARAELLPFSLRRPSNRPTPSHRRARQPQLRGLSWEVPPVPLRYAYPPASNAGREASNA
eukprot:12539149-Alexandrium_andersonii.AAC.1